MTPPKSEQQTSRGKIYKHIKFNWGLQGVDWALEQVGKEWELEKIVPVDIYESIAVFSTPPKQEVDKKGVLEKS